MPHLAAYVGWGWNHFKSKKSGSDPDYDFEETGYTFGLQFIHPLGNSGPGLLIRFGSVFNHVELEDSRGEIKADSGHALGWQIGSGLNVPLSDHWQLRPQRPLSIPVK